MKLCWERLGLFRGETLLARPQYGTASMGVTFNAVIFEDRESANAANDKVLKFDQASLLDFNLGDPEPIAGEVLGKIRAGA